MGELKAEIFAVYAFLCIKSSVGMITRMGPRTFAIFNRKRHGNVKLIKRATGDAQPLILLPMETR